MPSIYIWRPNNLRCFNSWSQLTCSNIIRSFCLPFPIRTALLDEPMPCSVSVFFGDVQRQPVVVLAMTHILFRQRTYISPLLATLVCCRAVFSARSSGKTTASVRLIVHSMHMLVPVKASKRVRVLDHRSGVPGPLPYPTLLKSCPAEQIIGMAQDEQGVLVHACQKLRPSTHACMHGSASDSD